ncbi:Indoleamine 2,3-dioxygenase [Cantharellus anzutake]|uniref:Indoleamine 2,3-dioxygenase n=1 Tax=Cantharellus anzutake TaxID=1750568 RepID=UPI001903961A|nr:Indoleamine 2,3-dioxygenase [Cantharellus anzutake]KAF8330068.1 Indoleamine 2,3-dioxygenase [Cantharellus anzutake]
MPSSPMITIKSIAHTASNILGAKSARCVESAPRSTLKLVDYDISPVTGFAPSASPCTRLPSPFDAWERALDLVNCGTDSVVSLGEDASSEALAKRTSTERWQESIRAMPVLDTEILRSYSQLQHRAHHVLAYLVHFYVHSLTPNTTSAPVVPASLAIPLFAVSDDLGMAPILTYADTVLWNIAPRDPSKPLAPGNLRILTTFSGTDDEIAFYQCCADIELHGTRALAVMAAYENLDLRDLGRLRADILQTVCTGLDALTENIEDLITILRDVNGACSPIAFYNLIRPWFRGPSSGEVPWMWEGVGPVREEWKSLSGPSGGQSTLMHSLDVFLDIDHTMEKHDLRSPVVTREDADRTFMRRMQGYMPAIHRGFLHKLVSSNFSLRSMAISASQANSPLAHELVTKYNDAVCAMRRFRDVHLKIAGIYVVAQARKAAVEAGKRVVIPSACPVSAMLRRMAEEGDADLLAVCPVSGLGLGDVVSKPSACPIKGTGGTQLLGLLRGNRDSTTRTIIPTRR